MTTFNPSDKKLQALINAQMFISCDPNKAIDYLKNFTLMIEAFADISEDHEEAAKAEKFREIAVGIDYMLDLYEEKFSG